MNQQYGFVWGVSESGRRHAFALSCAVCRSTDVHRRSHRPHSLCGEAWAPDWPAVDVPGLRTCGHCTKLAEKVSLAGPQ